MNAKPELFFVAAYDIIADQNRGESKSRSSICAGNGRGHGRHMLRGAVAAGGWLQVAGVLHRSMATIYHKTRATRLSFFGAFDHQLLPTQALSRHCTPEPCPSSQ